MAAKRLHVYEAAASADGPRGGDWPVWKLVGLHNPNYPRGFLVTTPGERGLPRPVAVVHAKGLYGSVVAWQLATGGGKKWWNRECAVDYRDIDHGYAAEVFIDSALWPVTASGALVALPDGNWFGGRIVRKRGTRDMEFQDYDGRRWVFPASIENKNGTSQVTAETLMLAGPGLRTERAATAA